MLSIATLSGLEHPVSALLHEKKHRMATRTASDTPDAGSQVLLHCWQNRMRIHICWYPWPLQCPRHAHERSSTSGRRRCVVICYA